jgi:murein DD-endopeptidase MepM/ murein hydrolase activator NlpD
VAGRGKISAVASRVLGWIVVMLVLVWAWPAAALEVRMAPDDPRQGDLLAVLVIGAGAGATVEGWVGEWQLAFFPHGRGHAALVAVDLATAPGRRRWLVTVAGDRERTREFRGSITVRERAFPVQRLTLPPHMVDLDPATEQRALAEAAALRAIYDAVSPERLWKGPFVRPVAVDEEGSGFGARRVINGKPRAPHSGIDWAADVGTPVVAANRGRVALVAEYFFLGRLVVLDHGLGLVTLYSHLDRVDVEAGVLVERGQRIGAVGSTGRATGPHLHFAAQLQRARVDPHFLFSLPIPD